jgi:TolB-like protein/DNA-binding winged helix-turn-helix (wHTH) protein/tetratricopeptide (TPR) repeat protein
MSEIAQEARSGGTGTTYIDWQHGTVGPGPDQTVALRPQSLAVLRILHENAGQTVTKESLMASVWPDVAVTDDSIVQCIAEIRRALGDVDRTIVKTLPKRGYLYEPPPASPTDEPTPTRSFTYKSMGVAAAIAAAASLAAFVYLDHPAPKSVVLPAIAVLPFDNLGADPKGDKFADMMTEDVITDLSHSKDFAVIARNSTEVYKGKPIDARAVGHDLSVQYVLEGSVQALPGRVRATAQLISAATNSHIWSERFEAQGDDVFAVEASITNRIATSILSHDAVAANSERSLIRRKPPSQWSAYDAYQVGLEASHHMSPEFVPPAEESFAKALAIDPNFARAHLGLAWLNLLKILYGTEPAETALPKMLTEAKTAATLDPDDGEAHAALAQAYSLLHDTSKMESETTRALTLAPNNADILVLTSSLLVQSGKSDLALTNINTALNLNPNYPYWYNSTLYPALFYAGDYARSYDFAKEAAKAVDVNSDFLAMDAAYLGKSEEAAKAKQALLAIDPEWSAERLLSNFGNMSGDEELERLTSGAAKAGLRICMPMSEVAAKPDAIHLKSCDLERSKN